MAQGESDPSGHVANPEPIASEAGQLDPYPWYREMRETNPVRCDDKRGVWDLFRFDHVERAIKDHEEFSAESDTPFDRFKRIERIEFGDTIIASDPPTHTRLRSVVDDYFQTGTLEEQFGARMEELADELLDRMLAGDDEIDFMAEFAIPYPVTIIAEVLGVPTEDRDQFREWSYQMIASPDGETEEAMREVQRRQLEAVANTAEYFADLVEDRKANPRDDLMTIVARSDDLARDEVLAFCVLLLMAGNITTTNLLNNAIWMFARHGVYTDIKDGGISLRQAVDEVLRYRSPVQSVSRATTQDVEIGGTTIPEGELVIPWIGAANRDPDVFENPETFDPTRSPNKHMAYGRGIHTCLGAPLANLEATTGLRAFMDRVEDVELLADDLEPVDARPLHSVESLPIAVTR